jgi:tetratricopeptide (TPR) repeat protein
VDRGVIATAGELFEARHYPSVVAVCSDALDDEPECLPLVLLRARAYLALRRDLDAQGDLRDAIRLDPACSLAYRLLGVLAARRDEREPAAVFLREALRLDPGDREAQDWLAIVALEASRPPRAARGTRPHDPVTDDRPTQPFARGSDRDGHAWTPRTRTVQPTQTPAPLPPAPETPTLRGRPPIQPPAKAAARPRPAELPGFGEYLVEIGILTRERLRAAQAYQRSMRVQLATAIVTLGLATPQRIEWAAVAHQNHSRA